MHDGYCREEHLRTARFAEGSKDRPWSSLRQAPESWGKCDAILNSNAQLSLDVLISNEKVRQDFRSIINEANGIIIVSGPTGSGKSTLASALREKDSGDEHRHRRGSH